MNIFDLPKLPLNEELISILAENENIRIERIVSAGQTTGWYDQDEAEFVVLLEGFAIIEFDGGATVNLMKGDTLLINPHEKHRVSYTSDQPPCVWLCVFF